MNKKILFLILLGVVLIFPFTTRAGGFCTAIGNLTTLSEEIGGSLVVVGWIIAGILYLTAAGGSGMETGKKAIVAAVIGTILVIIATSAITIIADATKLTNGTSSCFNNSASQISLIG